MVSLDLAPVFEFCSTFTNTPIFWIPWNYDAVAALLFGSCFWVHSFNEIHKEVQHINPASLNIKLYYLSCFVHRCHYYDKEDNLGCTLGDWHPLSVEKLVTLHLNVGHDVEVFNDGFITIPGFSTCKWPSMYSGWLVSYLNICVQHKTKPNQ